MIFTYSLWYDAQVLRKEVGIILSETMVTSMKKRIKVCALAACVACAGAFIQATPLHAEPVAVSASASEMQWLDVDLGHGAYNNQGALYVPMDASFNALGAELAWNPQGQTDRVKVKAAGQGWQLYLRDLGGATGVATNPEGPWSNLVTVDGISYISLEFMQGLTQRTLCVTGSSLGIIDYQPTYDNTGYNTNPIWAGVMGGYTYDVPPQLAAKEAIVASGYQYMGVPYVWGGSTPAGFDCSGYTSYLYAQQGISLPRTAADQQYAATPISEAEAQPGDLVFWGSPAYHVGIYLGGGQYLHAPAPGQSVCVGYASWFPYSSIGRIV